MNLPFRKPAYADPVTIPRQHVETMIAELDRIKLDVGDALAYLADGTSGFAGCSACHSWLDVGWAGKMSVSLIRFHVIRAMQRAFVHLIETGAVKVKLDAEPKRDKAAKPAVGLQSLGPAEETQRPGGAQMTEHLADAALPPGVKP